MLSCFFFFCNALTTCVLTIQQLCCDSAATNFLLKLPFLRRAAVRFDDDALGPDEYPGISGTLPSELGLLTGLTSLDICTSGALLLTVLSFIYSS